MTTFNKEIGIVLLAAGSSSRMGRNKMTIVYKGITLIDRAVQAALSSAVDHTVVVSGANRKQNESLISRSEVELVFNESWESGIGSSIKCGLKMMMMKNKKLDAVIISVCDQPSLSFEIFDKLVDTYAQTGKQIIASAYGGIRGAPVLYDKVFFEDLLNIPDEHGAKQHLVENASEKIMATIPFAGGEVDIDTVEDLKKID